jgi:hypothetical protein
MNQKCLRTPNIRVNGRLFLCRLFAAGHRINKRAAQRWSRADLLRASGLVAGNGHQGISGISDGKGLTVLLAQIEYSHAPRKHEGGTSGSRWYELRPWVGSQSPPLPLVAGRAEV